MEGRARSRVRRHGCKVLLALLATGCQSVMPTSGNDPVSRELMPRIGLSLRQEYTPDAKPVMPSGVCPAEALTEDQAVAVALWNNARYIESLTDLGVAKGDLIQAHLLPNPELVYFPPVDFRSFKYLFDLQLEAFWLRGLRTEVAEYEAGRAAERLAQSALDLMRDARQAHADVLLAKERLRIAGEAVKIRKRIAELAKHRLEAGDIAPQEAATANIDALQAEQDAARIAVDLPIAEERLRNLLGLGAVRDPIDVVSTGTLPDAAFDADALAAEAMATRPDALAAQSFIAASESRLRLSKLSWIRVLFIGDATSGKDNHVFGPGFRITVPIFNWNQGAVARAEAEAARACRLLETVRQQVVLDVQRSYRQYRQAADELTYLRTKVRPEVESSIRRTQKAYEQGNVNYLLVLEATRQLLDSYTREAQLEADLRRAWAELERSVGRSLVRPEEMKP